MTALLFGLVLLAAVGGAGVTYFVMDGPRRRHVAALAAVEAREDRLADDRDQVTSDRGKLDDDRAKLDGYARRLQQAKADHDRQAAADRAALDAEAAALRREREEFDRRAITYATLQAENRTVKAELKHAALHALKLEADQEEQEQRTERVRAAADALGRLHLRESQEWVMKALTANNYALSKDRLRKVIDRVRGAGLDLPESEALPLFDALQQGYAKAVRADQARAEQAEIREQMREEQRLEREARDAVDQAAREQRLVEDALAKALADAHGQHADEIERLQTELAAAQAKSKRAQSNAETRKAGCVYVISNVGSFGEGVYKIGMTRRDKPQDRVDELGDASVPFPFDVHMMIRCTDAPSLERTLHQAFTRHRVNRMNPRREFFRVPLADIVRHVRQVHPDEVTVTELAEAAEYNEGLRMTDADADFVASIFEQTGPAPSADD